MMGSQQGKSIQTRSMSENAHHVSEEMKHRAVGNAARTNYDDFNTSKQDDQDSSNNNQWLSNSSNVGGFLNNTTGEKQIKKIGLRELVFNNFNQK